MTTLEKTVGKTSLVERYLQSASKSLAAFQSSASKSTEISKKSFVQTPLDTATAMVDALSPDLHVVDWGGGLGLLSVVAAARGFTITCIESDDRLAQLTRDLVSEVGLNSAIDVVHGDALEHRITTPYQIISNPPYTRWHDLPLLDREKIRALKGQPGGLAGAPGLYAVFLDVAMALEQVKSLVFLVPSLWNDTRYGQEVIERSSHSWIIEEKTLGQGLFSEVSNHVSVLVGKRRNTSLKTRTILENPIANTPKRSVNGTVLRRSLRSLRIGDYWNVSRGVATGANKFFVVDEDTQHKIGIPESELVRVATTISKSGPAYSKLWTPGPDLNEMSDASQKYIDLGMELGFDQRYLCRTRTAWWHVTHQPGAEILMSYAWRGNPKFAVLNDKTRFLNGMLGWNRVKSFEKSVADELILWLQSKIGIQYLEAHVRDYGQGWKKLEPGQIKELCIPISWLTSIDLPKQ